MNTYTAMAVDAFRKVKKAERRLVQAQVASQQAARLIPREEFDLWVLATEVVRLESDQMTAQRERDTETYDLCVERLAELRGTLKAMDEVSSTLR